MTIKKVKETPGWRVICTGMVCIAGVEIYALSQGVNGWMLGIALAILGGAIGVYIPRPAKLP